MAKTQSVLPSAAREGDLAAEKEPDSQLASKRSATIPMENTMRSSARKKQLADAAQGPANAEQSQNLPVGGAGA